MKIIRVITNYHKVSEILINETDISFIDKDYLIKIFSPPINDPEMYNSYEIDEKKVLDINKIINIKFDFQNFDYFIECYQDG